MTDALHHRGPDASGVHQSGARRARAHAAVDHRPVDRRQPADAERGRPGRAGVQRRDLQLPRARRGAARRGRRAAHPFGHRGAAASCTACTGRRSSARCAACSRSRSGTRPGGAWCWGAIAWARSRCTFTSASAGCRSRRSCRRCSPTATSSAAPTRARCTPTWRSATCRPTSPPSRGCASWRPAASPCSRTASWRRSATGSCASQPRQRSAEDFVEELRHHLFEAVKLRLVSDVPLGAFLSGGIDSSAVVAIMSKVGAKPVKTFSIGFDEKDFSEVTYARQVARLYETDHHEEVLRPHAAELLPRLVHAYGEPFADPSALPTYLLSRDDPPARHGRAVGRRRRRGARRLHPLRAREDDAPVPAPARGRCCCRSRASSSGASRGARRASSASSAPPCAMHARRVQMGDIPRYAAQFGHFTPEQMAELCSPELQAAGADAGRALFGRLLSEATATDALGRLLELDTKTYLVDDIFTKVDIASMQNSLEVRCPLVDHVLIEFAATVPSDLKMRGFPRQVAVSQGAARSAAPQHPLPAEARLRHPARALAARRAAPAAARHVALAARVRARPAVAPDGRAADRRARHGPREPRPAPLEPALARAVAPGVHRRPVARPPPAAAAA